MKKNYSLPSRWFGTILLVTSLISGATYAQPGTNDPAFNIPDKGPNSFFKGSNDWITCSALSNNKNKIILAGRFTMYNGQPASRIVRLNGNGSTDTNFNSGSGFNNDPTTLLVQDNNRVIVGGGFTTYNGTMANGIVRLAANGSIDNSFVTGTGFDGMVTSALLQTDGKIIVAGQFTSYNGTPVNKILRLKKNGSIDNTFSLNGLANKAPQKMTLQADGKIVLAYSTIEEVDLKRLNTDGSIDGSYSAIIPITDPDGVDTYFPTTRALLTQSDGKILVGGSYFFGNSPSFHFLKRVNVNGMLDTTFHSPYEEQAISGGGPVFTICLQNDGKIIIGGKGEEHSNGSQNLSTSFISRLNVNGSLDNTFHQNNRLSKPNLGVYTTEILTDGKIIVAGFFPELNTYAAHNIARLNTDGTFDISFNKITGANGEIMASAVQPNGRIIIAGNFSAFHFQSRNHVARLLENGKLDHSFNVGTGTNGTVSAVAVQADKKILIAGNFSSYNDHPVPGLVRVNSNGSIDASFDPGTGADGPINTIVVQDDNKIVIGGSFTQVNGNNSNAIARLNSNGSFDTDFTSPIASGFSTNVYTIRYLGDGKIFVGGLFTANGNGTQRNDFVRLNSDGSLDPSIQQVYSSAIRSIAIQPDNKLILAGGEEPVGKSLGYGNVKRYFSDGSADNTFSGGFDLGNTFPVYSITLLNSGKIIAGGHFNSYGGVAVQNIMQLDSTGIVDTAFVGIANGTVYNTHLVADEKIILSGSFNTYTDIARNGIARINTVSADPYRTMATNATVNSTVSGFHVYPNPASRIINFDGLTPGSLITIRNITGAIVHSEQVNNAKFTLNLSGYSNGIYFVTQQEGTETTTTKFVVTEN